MFILGNGPILLSAEKDQAKTNSAKVETNTELKTQKKAVEKDKAKASSKKAKLVRVDKEKLAKRAKLIRKKNIAIDSHIVWNSMQDEDQGC